MMSSECIFCKIINDEIPSKKLYESEKVLAFLDAFPLSRGHFLVIPKTHSEKLHQVADDELKEILIVIKELTSKAGLTNYNILQNNGKLAHQFVFHVHFHVIPKNSDTYGLVMSWDAKQASEEELENASKMFT